MGMRGGNVLIVGADRPSRSSVEKLVHEIGVSGHILPDAAALSRYGRPEEPSCLVFDMHEGADAAQTMGEIGMRIPAIFLCRDGNIITGVRAMKAGAFDFLPKPVDRDHLRRSIESALVEDSRQLDGERSMTRLRRRFITLTLREQEVFFAVTSGLLNKQIAAELGISEKTVKVHRGRVTRKLEAISLPQLVRMADRIRPGGAGLNTAGAGPVSVLA